jgi:hypothetical protein
MSARIADRAKGAHRMNMRVRGVRRTIQIRLAARDRAQDPVAERLRATGGGADSYFRQRK